MFLQLAQGPGDSMESGARQARSVLLSVLDGDHVGSSWHLGLPPEASGGRPASLLNSQSNGSFD
jgi:hypothetical protein